MLRFTGRRTARNYLGRREQYRLLSLFGLLALVLVLMRLAGNQDSWTWLFQGDERRMSAQRAADAEPVDSRRPDTLRESPDVVRIAKNQPTAAAATDSLPGLRQDLFGSVEDDTVLRGGAEHEAYFHTLAVLKHEDELSASLPAPAGVTFVQLFRQPESYRGQWVRIHGVARRAVPIQTPTNVEGITELHQLWIQPENRPDDLLAVDVLQLPPGFPTGAAVKAPVTVDGVFFKRWAYQAEDGIRTAPLLLARTVTWKPDASPGTEERFSSVEIASAVFASLGIGGVILWMLYKPAPAVKYAAAAPDLRTLAEQDQGSDVARTLAELSEREGRDVNDA